MHPVHTEERSLFPWRIGIDKTPYVTTMDYM